MKVVHILASNKFSGAENVVITICKNMQKKNPEIYNYYLSPKGDIEEVLKKENITYIPVKKLSIYNISKVLKEIKPDVIHAHDFTASIFVACIISFRGKIISHIHNNPLWIKKYCLKSLIFLLTTIRYSKILTVSESIENEYIFASMIKNKIKCIGNPINIKQIIVKSREYEIKESYDMVFVGRMTKQKNIGLLINICNKLVETNQNVRIAIVGDGELLTMLRYKLKNIMNIDIYGFVDNPYPIIKKSKSLCLPSKWEGFGLVAVEALALGVPVVCSGVGGLSNIVNDQCGKICGFNLQTYVKEILAYMNDAEYHKFKVNQSYIQSQKLDNINNYIDILKNIYEVI